jgi:hypothetical protein
MAPALEGMRKGKIWEIKSSFLATAPALENRTRNAQLNVAHKLRGRLL